MNTPPMCTDKRGPSMRTEHPCAQAIYVQSVMSVTTTCSFHSAMYSNDDCWTFLADNILSAVTQSMGVAEGARETLSIDFYIRLC